MHHMYIHMIATQLPTLLALKITLAVFNFYTLSVRIHITLGGFVHHVLRTALSHLANVYSSSPVPFNQTPPPKKWMHLCGLVVRIRFQNHLLPPHRGLRNIVGCASPSPPLCPSLSPLSPFPQHPVSILPYVH